MKRRREVGMCVRVYMRLLTLTSPLPQVDASYGSWGREEDGEKVRLNAAKTWSPHCCPRAQERAPYERVGGRFQQHGEPSEVCCAQSFCVLVLITPYACLTRRHLLSPISPVLRREWATRGRWPTYGDLADVSTDVEPSASRQVLCARNICHFSQKSPLMPRPRMAGMEARVPTSYMVWSRVLHTLARNGPEFSTPRARVATCPGFDIMGPGRYWAP